MKFKGILVGALVPPRGNSGGSLGPWQVFCPTKEEVVELGKGILATLPTGVRKTAYVRVVEIAEVLVAEIHTAAEAGPSGELLFTTALDGVRR
jgi:hypothetical protein